MFSNQSIKKVLEAFSYAVAVAGLLTILTALTAAQRQAEPTYTISTVAGSGERGYAGDNGSAINAKLNQPTAVAIDKTGNLYIADNGNHRIRKVATDGTITTFAGTGERGFGGDGGLAVKALFNRPYGVQVDPQGNVLIADQGNNRIRKITADGRISTVAGNGTQDFSGDGGLATSASLSQPNDVTADKAGNLYIADSGNHRVRKVTPDGRITTIAGTGQLRYNGESGYSGDGGRAIKARLNLPSEVIMDGMGNLYIGDFSNHTVRKITPDGIISTVAGTGKRGFNGDNIPAIQAQLNEPGGIALALDGSLLIADGINYRIRRVGFDGIIQTIAGNGKRAYSGDGGVASSAELSVLDIMTIDSKGNIYVADFGNNRIRRLTPNALATTNSSPTATLTAPANREAEELLARMREAYKNTQSAKINYTFRRSRFDKGAVMPKGMIDFAVPGKMNVEFSFPDYGNVRVYSDGKQVTTLDPAEEKPDVREFSIGTLSQMIPSNLEIICFYDWERQLTTGDGGNMQGSSFKIIKGEKWNGRDWTVLEETAESAGVVVRYFIEPKTNLIWRTQSRNLLSKQVTYDGWITALELGIKIAEERFKSPTK